jgi:hypothetical protein
MKKEIIALVVLVIVIVGLNFAVPFLQKTAVVPVATTTSEVSIGDWKTYKNDQYGFEFKYPPTWYMSEVGGLFLYDHEVGPGLSGANIIIQLFPNRDQNYPAWNKYTNEGMKEYAERFADYNKGPGELLDISENYLSGSRSSFYQVSTKTVDREPVWGCESDPCPEPPIKNIEHRMVTTYIPQGDSVFLIIAKMSGGPGGVGLNINSQEEKEYLEIYQQILSTFKFTK